ncbi:MAG: sulfur carrier protein ThiS [Pseudomonadales bacterium]|nr:sulfur carrier protein ThiS [Pseudomonadales bacterium]
MLVNVNGDPVDLPDEFSVLQLLMQLGLARQKVAVELNREIVPRSEYSDRLLQPADVVEIVQAIGGG